MQENEHVSNEETKGKRIEDLFEHETFLRYSPLFYESPKTITQISEDTGVSRNTWKATVFKR